jgi:hypothetical protein
VTDATTEEARTDVPADPAAVAEAVASELRDLLWAEAPYGDPCAPTNQFSLLHEEDYSVEDRATRRGTVVMRTPDGRYWHATITVTAVEQTTRTPAGDDFDDDDEDPGYGDD